MAATAIVAVILACLAVAAVLGRLGGLGGPARPPGPADPFASLDRTDHDAGRAAGPTRPAGPAGGSCAGVDVAIGSDIQSLIDAHPEGTTFCLAPGVHRIETPLAPKAGDSLIGRPQAVLSGSKLLTGWREDGGVWAADGFLPAEPGTSGQCRSDAPSCAMAEDVFLDGRRLARVGERSAVTAGTVYADYRTNTITIGDDPAGRLVEQAVAPSLVRGVVDGVTIAHLVLEQAASPAQTGAVEARQVSPQAAGSGWRVENNEIRLGHGIGVGVGGRSAVSANRIHDQGQLGFAVWGTGTTVSDNVVSGNGAAGYSFEWEAGGCKLWATDGVTLAHNDVRDNLGPGLWADGGNIRTAYLYNVIAGNWGAGIQHEISYDAVIRHNEISGNGRSGKGWVWGAGVQIQSSGGNELIEVAYNVVRDNANGVTVVDSGDRGGESPAPHGRHVVRNVWVHDNTITLRAGQLTGTAADGPTAVFTDGQRISFDHNTYRLDPPSGRFFAWGHEELDWQAWRELGPCHDGNGRVEPLPGPGGAPSSG
jgi:hypothetical protein